jgi:transposase
VPEAPIKQQQTSQQRKRRKRLKPKQVERIRRMLVPNDEGEPAQYTVSELAELLQLPYFTVYGIHVGWSYKDVAGPIVSAKKLEKKVTPERAERIVKLRARGASIPKLSRATGLSASTIKRILKEREQ